MAVYNFCDVVVLTLNEPIEQLRQCLASLEHPLLRVHVKQGIENSIGVARANSFFTGIHPFMMFADPDDVYDAQVIAEMLEMFNRKPFVDIMYSGEFITDYKKGKNRYWFSPYAFHKHSKTPMHVHGVKIFRRSAVTQKYLDVMLPFKHKFELWALTLFMAHKKHVVYGYNRPGQVWNQHENNTSKIISKHDRKAVVEFLQTLEG